MIMIGIGILLGLIAFMCILGGSGPIDRAREDEEQIRYLEEWRLKHETRKHYKN